MSARNVFVIFTMQLTIKRSVRSVVLSALFVTRPFLLIRLFLHVFFLIYICKVCGAMYSNCLFYFLSSIQT